MSVRRASALAVFGLLTAIGAAAASKPSPILPNEFGGWRLTGTAKTSADPAAADPVNAALLKEYGFTDLASGVYTRDDGRKLTLKAARFTDATGAYGAFTYYKLPQMLPEEIGDQGASLNDRVLFYRGNILIDAVFQRLSVMSAAELRELSGLLPLPQGGDRKPPTLPNYLPAQSRVTNSIKYVIGPVGLQQISAPLPPQLVDFNAGAEVTLADYNTSGGSATLMLISYPTPQIAATQLRRIDAARKPGSPEQASLGSLEDRRTGPILALVSGPATQSEAQSLLASVNYDAEVTWNQSTYFDRKNNVANLLVNVILLCGILAGFMLVAGIAFGGARILLRRAFPNRLLDRSEEVEFISLHLTVTREEPPPPR